MSSVIGILKEHKSFFDQIQEEAGLWADNMFGVPRTDSMLEHLKDELAELMEHSNDPSELADCMLLLSHIARRSKVSMAQMAIDTREPFRSLDPKYNLLLVFMDLYKDPSRSNANALIGMMFLDLLCICDGHGLNPRRCLKEKFDIVRSREWSEPDSRGVVRHKQKSRLEVPVTCGAPWDDTQVASINAYQHSDLMHPFTNGHDENGQEVILEARRDGLFDPRTQTLSQMWVHDWMADWSWREILQHNQELMLSLVSKEDLA